MSEPESIANRPRAAFRHDEQFAAAVVEQVLKARVEPRYVLGAPPGTVDGEIHYPDGHTAALEITGVEQQWLKHLRAKLKGRHRSKAPGRLTWSINPANVADLLRLDAIHERIILLTESSGRSSPNELPIEMIARDPDLQWIVWESASAIAGYESPGAPTIWWSEPNTTAVFTNEADEISAGLADAILIDPIKNHLEKLLLDPHEERHLFVIVGTNGLSSSAAFALIGSPTLPHLDPEIPKGIDHLWLAPGWGGTVTVWTRGIGWRNELVEG